MNTALAKPERTLPSKAYTDAGIFKAERSEIIGKTWQYVGHVEKVRNAGDYFVTDVDGESLIIIRDETGKLNGFFNVCLHKASRLLSGEGCRQRISCPYHGWTYDKSGKLIGAPNSRDVPGFSIDDYRLMACRVEELHGLVFVNLDPECASLKESVTGVEEQLKEYAPQLPEMTFAHRTEAYLKSNWKVAVENYSECYHCALVHKSFFAESEEDGVNASSYRIEDQGNWHLHTADAFNEMGERDHQNEFAAWWLWPNFAVQSHPGCVLNVRKWTPIDEANTHVAVDWYFMEGEFDADAKAMVEHHAATVFQEDIPLVESVQLGLTSRAYDTGPLMIDTRRSECSEHAVASIQSLWRRAMNGVDTA